MKNPPWLQWPIGVRVTVRRALPTGYSDVVGVLLRCDATGVTLRTRHDEVVEIPAHVIALGRVVGPRRR